LLVIQIDILRGSIVMDWLRDRERYNLREEISRIVDLFLHGATSTIYRRNME